MDNHSLEMDKLNPSGLLSLCVLVTNAPSLNTWDFLNVIKDGAHQFWCSSS